MWVPLRQNNLATVVVWIPLRQNYLATGVVWVPLRRKYYLATGVVWAPEDKITWLEVLCGFLETRLPGYRCCVGSLRHDYLARFLVRVP